MRDLGLLGAPNARDLGGLPVGGRVVRPGRLYRASALGRLTDEDVPVLGRLGLRTVVDLRDVSEIELAPPDRLPEPAPELVKLPVYDPAHPLFTYVAAVLLGHDGAGYAALAEQGTPGAMAAIYRWFVADETARVNFAAAVRLIADPRHLPSLVHCTAGKDRTGWLSVIVLSVLGVDRAVIEADYLHTNAAAEAVNTTILSALRSRRPDLNEAAIWPVFEARTAYLEAAYDEVERRYGTFDAYLHSGLGLSADVLAALRTNLLD